MAVDDDRVAEHALHAPQRSVPHDHGERAWNYSYLTQYQLTTTLNVTELGTSAPISPNNSCGGGGYPVVWSGTNWDGNAVPAVATQSCSNWTSAVVNSGLSWGLASVIDYWSYWCTGGSCSWTAPIYCFQQ